jgi:tetratricopeptide (TPR) repeat protein
LLLHHGALLLAAGEYSNAANTFRDAWERLPETAAADDRARTAIGRAWAALYLGDLKNAADLAYGARPFAAGDEQLLAAIKRLDGSVLFARGRIAEAKPHWAKALKRDRQRWGESHPAIAQSLSGEAVLLGARGDYAKAEAAALQALAAISERVGEQHPETVRLLTVLADIAYLHGDQKVGGSERQSYDDALLLAQRGETIAASFLSEDHPLLADVADAAARAHLGLRQVDKAQLAVSKAKEIRLKRLAPDHPSLATTCLTEGMIAHFRGDLPAARQLLERADELARNAAGDSKAHYGRAEPLLALSALGTVHSLPYPAERYYGGARSSLRTAAGDAVIAYQLSRWGNLYRRHNRRVEARWFYEKALAIYRNLLPRDPQRYRPYIDTISEHLRKLQ